MVTLPDTAASITGADGELAQRLRDYARQIVLLADQLDALRQGSVLRFRLLGAERDRLRQELAARDGAAVLDPVADHGATIAELDRLLHQALGELQDRTVTGELLRERMAVLQDGARQAVHRIERRQLGQGSYRAGGMAGGRLDLRR